MYELTGLNPDAMRAEIAYRHGLLAGPTRRERGRGRRWRRRHRTNGA